MSGHFRTLCMKGFNKGSTNMYHDNNTVQPECHSYQLKISAFHVFRIYYHRLYVQQFNKLPLAKSCFSLFFWIHAFVILGQSSPVFPVNVAPFLKYVSHSFIKDVAELKTNVLFIKLLKKILS